MYGAYYDLSRIMIRSYRFLGTNFWTMVLGMSKERWIVTLERIKKYSLFCRSILLIENKKEDRRIGEEREKITM